MNHTKEICEKCFDSHEIFNGKEMIPCPACTDSTFKSKDYQEIKFKLLKEVTDADQATTEEAKET